MQAAIVKMYTAEHCWDWPGAVCSHW